MPTDTLSRLRLRRPVAGSLAVHLVAVALSAYAARHAARAPASRDAHASAAIELDLVAARPPAARPSTDAAPAEPAALARAVAPPAVPAPRHAPPHSARAPAVTPSVEPRSASAPPASSPSPPVPRLSAAELFAPVDPGAATAALGAFAGVGTGVSRGDRALFGRPGGAPDAGQVARAPTEGLLAEAHHAQPAGTMNHDRTAARRAIEALAPLFRSPAVASLVMRARPQPMQYIAHTPSAGEAALNEEAAFGHGGNGLPPVAYGGFSTCPPRRIVTIRIEVEQDAAESVTAARVVQSSRNPEIDAVALAAVRESIAHARPIGAGLARRSRWLVQISNRPSASRTVCTEGFMEVPPDPVGGVYLMFRVMAERP